MKRFIGAQKVGGIYFLRIWRFRFSWCIASRESHAEKLEKLGFR